MASLVASMAGELNLDASGALRTSTLTTTLKPTAITGMTTETGGSSLLISLTDEKHFFAKFVYSFVVVVLIAIQVLVENLGFIMKGCMS